MNDSPVLAFSQPLPAAGSLSEEEFLKAVAWTQRAPKAVVAAARKGDTAGIHLERLLPGGNAKTVARRKDAAECLSSWSRLAFEESPRANKLLAVAEAANAFTVRANRKMGVRRARTNGKTNGRSTSNLGSTPRRLEKQLADCLKEFEVGSPASPFELLILFELLSRSGRQLPSDVYRRLWQTALTAAIRFSSNLDKADSGECHPDRRLLIRGELPWQAGLLFGSIKGADAFGRAGRRFLIQELLDRTDTDGMPQAELLDRLGLWLAPLVRASQCAKNFRVSLWDEEAAGRFRNLVKVGTPLCLASVRPVAGNGSPRDLVPMLTSASRLAGCTPKSPVTRLLNGDGTTVASAGKRAGVQTSKSTAPPANQSDWAQLACLRNDWSTDADALVIAHDREIPRISLTTLGTPLLSGVWDISVMIDGKPLEFKDNWFCVCWQSDNDGDYLELQATLKGNLQVERQLFLSRNDHFALLADTVTGGRAGTIEYTSRLPLVEAVVADCALRTRECVLKTPRQSARVFPLALPKDRVHSTPGRFEPVDGRLEYSLTAMGGIYAPLVIDWHPARRRNDADWNSLTVTEQRIIVKRDRASGHRLRIGKHQLLVYRSLAKSKESRAVLGLHTFYETVVGKFDTGGTVSPLVMVE